MRYVNVSDGVWCVDVGVGVGGVCFVIQVTRC